MGVGAWGDGAERTNSIRVSTACVLRDAISVVDTGGLQVALVVDDAGRLVGLLSDGDIRRALLNGATLSDPIEGIMKVGPRTVDGSPSIDVAYEVMKSEGIRHLPFVDFSGRITGLVVESDFFYSPPALHSSVLIMAGGRGRRLGPITDATPKPMVEIGGKPLLERIIDRCVASGFQHFIISLGYLKDQIRDYFRDGSAWGVEISYVEEEEPLGTAGALSLLPADITASLVVVNGDVLTNMNLSSILRFHHDRSAFATVGVRDHSVEIPFGVIESEESSVKRILEKPVLSHFVSAGVYVLEPEVVKSVPKGQYLDMPDLLSDTIAAGHEVSAFPLYEDWLDVGSPQNLDVARSEWVD